MTKTCNGGSSFDLLSGANHLPAAAGASLRVSFMPDTAPEIIRQPKRLECAKNIRTPEGVQRTRGVAKGPPSGHPKTEDGGPVPASRPR